MGYYIRERKPLTRAHHWKIQFVSHRKEDVVHSFAVKPKKEWDIPKSEWNALGFKAGMSLIEARERAKQLNAK